MKQASNLQDYNLRVRGVKRIDIEQIIEGEVKYDLRVTEVEGSRLNFRRNGENKIEINKHYNGVILNTTIGCTTEDVSFYYDTNRIYQIGCGSILNASINPFMTIRYRMSDLNSTTEFLQGIKDWVQLENFPNFYLMLHAQLSLVKVGTYTTIKSFV